MAELGNMGRSTVSYSQIIKGSNGFSSNQGIDVFSAVKGITFISINTVYQATSNNRAYQLTKLDLENSIYQYMNNLLLHFPTSTLYIINDKVNSIISEPSETRAITEISNCSECMMYYNQVTNDDNEEKVDVLFHMCPGMTHIAVNNWIRNLSPEYKAGTKIIQINDDNDNTAKHKVLHTIHELTTSHYESADITNQELLREVWRYKKHLEKELNQSTEGVGESEEYSPPSLSIFHPSRELDFADIPKPIFTVIAEDETIFRRLLFAQYCDIYYITDSHVNPMDHKFYFQCLHVNTFVEELFFLFDHNNISKVEYNDIYGLYVNCRNRYREYIPPRPPFSRVNINYDFNSSRQFNFTTKDVASYKLNKFRHRNFKEMIFREPSFNDSNFRDIHFSNSSRDNDVRTTRTREWQLRETVKATSNKAPTPDLEVLRVGFLKKKYQERQDGLENEDFRSKLYDNDQKGHLDHAEMKDVYAKMRAKLQENGVNLRIDLKDMATKMDHHAFASELSLGQQTNTKFFSCNPNQYTPSYLKSQNKTEIECKYCGPDEACSCPISANVISGAASNAEPNTSTTSNGVSNNGSFTSYSEQYQLVKNDLINLQSSLLEKTQFLPNSVFNDAFVPSETNHALKCLGLDLLVGNSLNTQVFDSFRRLQIGDFKHDYIDADLDSSVMSNSTNSDLSSCVESDSSDLATQDARYTYSDVNMFTLTEDTREKLNSPETNFMSNAEYFGPCKPSDPMFLYSNDPLPMTSSVQNDSHHAPDAHFEDNSHAIDALFDHYRREELRDDVSSLLASCLSPKNPSDLLPSSFPINEIYLKNEPSMIIHQPPKTDLPTDNGQDKDKETDVPSNNPVVSSSKNSPISDTIAINPSSSNKPNGKPTSHPNTATTSNTSTTKSSAKTTSANIKANIKAYMKSKSESKVNASQRHPNTTASSPGYTPTTTGNRVVNSTSENTNRGLSSVVSWGCNVKELNSDGSRKSPQWTNVIDLINNSFSKTIVSELPPIQSTRYQNTREFETCYSGEYIDIVDNQLSTNINEHLPEHALQPSGGTINLLINAQGNIHINGAICGNLTLKIDDRQCIYLTLLSAPSADIRLNVNNLSNSDNKTPTFLSLHGRDMAEVIYRGLGKISINVIKMNPQ